MNPKSEAKKKMNFMLRISNLWLDAGQCTWEMRHVGVWSKRVSKKYFSDPLRTGPLPPHLATEARERSPRRKK